MNAELIKMLDNAIASCSGRDIISTGEMVDMLLDMRILVLQEEQLEGADK